MYDLGRDVPTHRFIEEAEKVGADLIGSSALLTTTMEIQKRLEEELKKGKEAKPKATAPAAELAELKDLKEKVRKIRDELQGLLETLG